MRKTYKRLTGVVLTIGLFFFTLSSCSTGGSSAQVKTGEQTITGEVIDMSCYMGHGATGASHKKCAETCILTKKLPAGILTEDGQIYLLVENHDAADAYKEVLQHAAENVTASGKVIVKNGVTALVIEKLEI